MTADIGRAPIISAATMTVQIAHTTIGKNHSATSVPAAVANATAAPTRTGHRGPAGAGEIGLMVRFASSLQGDPG